jgi:hypothetical protein
LKLVLHGSEAISVEIAMETRIQRTGQVLDRRGARVRSQARGVFGVEEIQQMLENFDVAFRTGQESYYLGPLFRSEARTAGCLLWTATSG